MHSHPVDGGERLNVVPDDCCDKTLSNMIHTQTNVCCGGRRASFPQHLPENGSEFRVLIPSCRQGDGGSGAGSSHTPWASSANGANRHSGLQRGHTHTQAQKGFRQTMTQHSQEHTMALPIFRFISLRAADTMSSASASSSSNCHTHTHTCRTGRAAVWKGKGAYAVRHHVIQRLIRHGHVIRGKRKGTHRPWHVRCCYTSVGRLQHLGAGRGGIRGAPEQ